MAEKKQNGAKKNTEKKPNKKGGKSAQSIIDNALQGKQVKGKIKILQNQRQKINRRKKQTQKKAKAVKKHQKILPLRKRKTASKRETRTKQSLTQRLKSLS